MKNLATHRVSKGELQQLLAYVRVVPTPADLPRRLSAAVGLAAAEEAQRGSTRSHQPAPSVATGLDEVDASALFGAATGQEQGAVRLTDVEETSL